MGKVKNQHFVPRSYLRSFSNKKNQLWVYDKETDAVFPSNITNIASQNYFYDIPFEEIFEVISKDEKKELEEELLKVGFDIKQEGYESLEQGIEEFFATKIEGPYKKMLDKIRSRYTLNPKPLFSEALTLEERQHLSLLIAYQIVRSREFRESLIETQKGTMQALVDRIAKMQDKDYEYGSVSVERKHEFPIIDHAEVITGDFPLELAQILINHCWIVGVNQTEMPFYTSDNPVIKVGHKRHPMESYEGYNSEGIEIALPITRKLILIMYERTYHKKILNLESSFVPLTDIRHIKYYNSLQVIQSNRQIYCPDKKFQLINSMKKKYGSIKRIPKEIIVNGRDF